jgi:cell division protein FtsQ
MMKKALVIVFWVVLGIALVAILILAKNQNESQIAKKPNISIHVEGENAFLNEKELMERLELKKLYKVGIAVDKIDIKKIEAFIRAMDEIKKVKVFKNIGNTWDINVELRRPIARIYPASQNSFYLDDEGYTINRTHLHTARVLIISGEITENLSKVSVKEIINNDSLKSIRKIDDIYRISNYVCNDSFFKALIGQVYLEKNGDFILIPIVGKQTILFGSAFSDEEVNDKFNRLKIFYKQGMPYEGWDKYNTIIVKYDGQIVGRK